MKSFFQHKQKYMLVLVVLGAALLATACDEKSTTSAMCAYVVGDGDSGHDSKVKKVYYPDNKIDYDNTSEVVRYVPCNSRNYIINPPGQKNAAGKIIGDRHTPTIAYTMDGTQVKVWSHALWTLNESDSAMRKFWKVCLKYKCAEGSGSSGDSNFATAGWNGMTGEVFGPSQDRSEAAAVETYGDVIWQKPSAATYKKIGEDASALFADSIQQEVGYSDHLFCGSGNSDWPNPSKPGKGEFHCSNVRIIIDSIEPVNTKLAAQVQSTSLNQQRLTKAKDLYGGQAAYWLGLQDTIDQCKNSRTTCVINIGGASSIPVNVTGK